MSATYRRDYLKKRIEKGQVEGRLGYSYNEHSGVQRGEGWIPVELGEEHERKDGVMLLSDWALNSSCGRAYWEDRDAGELTLIVHSNLWYDLRIVD